MRAIPIKTITVCAALVMIVVISLAFTAPPERRFKNLKVLPKNIGEQELDSIMHTYTRGLGVKCDFCHVPTADRKTDFISDEKPEKNIARKMMRMTNKINKKYFDYERNEQGKLVDAMTCYSCHHGQAHPAKNPPPRQRSNNQVQASQDSTSKQ